MPRTRRANPDWRAVAPSPTSIDARVDLEKSEAVMVAFRDRLPIGRAATPDEVAGMIPFLASEEALFINGVNLPIDGGLHASNGRLNFLLLFGRGSTPDRSRGPSGPLLPVGFLST
jgi:meso-butanediol dehydrogenase / (S,S)-butanediol dehydrogenase / diacetyl reductase